MLDEGILKTEERAAITLRTLYSKYGYQPYKMSKFEEYDLYARNKDFLVSDSVITFTDTTGKLMALKPDVTLSIIRNYQDEPGVTQRVYYNENVYRVSDETHQYKEILQTGLECMGEIDFFNLCEVLSLAVEGLRSLSGEFVLEISHMGILSGLLNSEDVDKAFIEQISTLIADKNAHEIPRVCEQFDVPQELCDKLVRFVGVYGTRDKVLTELETLCEGEEMEAALQQLKDLSAELDGWKDASRIRFDFSLVNDMRYYDGIVFQGYVENIPDVILTGGQYDRLMKRMGRKSGAIGFALYLDLLDSFLSERTTYDVDVILLYDDDADLTLLKEMVATYIKKGLTVSVQKQAPKKLSCRQLVRFNNKGVEILETND